MTRRIVITGVGVVAPSGIGAEAFWSNSEAGRSFIERDERMAELGTRSTVLSRVRAFRPDRFFAPGSELLDEDAFVQYGVAAGMLAVADAGLDRSMEDRERVGCIASTAIGGTPTVAATWDALTDGGRHELRWRPAPASFAHATCSNYPGTVVMRRYGFGGPSTALSTGCTAGLDSLGLCLDVLAEGDASVMIAGASEAPLADISYATLDVIGALSTAEGHPSRASRPFDAKRAGFVLGEGAAFVVLEELSHATARGARVRAEVLAFASGGNAYHMSDLPDDGLPMARIVADAVTAAGVRPAAIAYINAHGSSTQQNDVFETNAYKAVFGRRTYGIPISSTKSMVGHSLSSASLLGVVAAVGAIERSVIPPTANYEDPDPRCDLDYVPNRCRQADVATALVTASGFGGIHSATVVKRYG